MVNAVILKSSALGFQKNCFLLMSHLVYTPILLQQPKQSKHRTVAVKSVPDEIFCIPENLAFIIDQAFACFFR